MCQVVNIIISSRVPNIQFQLRYCSIIVFYLRGLVEVLHGISWVVWFPPLRLLFHKGFNDAGLADFLIAHYNNLSSLEVRLVI